ncbi:MAG: choice-of-anchor tandem repeat GloVer-containing protein [Verrucomicrobiota bacterium]
MKTHINRLFLLPALTAGLGLILAGRVAAQTFTTLYSFTATNGLSAINSDGAHPYAGLVLSGGILYGTAYVGGTNGVGSLFAVSTNGTGFTNLFNFKNNVVGGGGGGGGASAGYDPSGRLILSGSTLYGTANYYAAMMNPPTGAVFKFDIGGAGISGLADFQPLSSAFTNGTGAHPHGGLVISGNNLYGTAYDGGRYKSGTVFTTTTNGTVITNLYNFSDNSSSLNSDGANPEAELVLSGNTLYGTAYNGGPSGNGTIFAVNTDGTGFTNLYSFTTRSSGTNSDGAHPFASLLLSGNTLYGTTQMGGTSRNGTVFSLSTNGTGFATLHNFSAFNNNTDGGNPEAGLVLSGTTLYGTAYAGGSSGNGTVFALNTDGTGFTTLYSFTALSSGTNGDGANPSGGLLLSGNTLYGTAQNGGNAGNGTVFSLTVPPPLLNIQPIGNSNVVLSWPTNFTGFTLEANTNLGSNVWSVVSPAPSVSGTNNVVTNAISGAARFYRLSQ